MHYLEKEFLINSYLVDFGEQLCGGESWLSAPLMISCWF